MKNRLFFLTVSFLLPLSSAFAQTLMDYVSAVKGDTLVIKDYYEMGNQSNSLFYALVLDTVDVPEGRVYELRTNGYYPLILKLLSSAKHRTVIVGPDTTMVLNNKNASSSPPLICDAENAGGDLGSGVGAGGDLTIKNCELVPASNEQGMAWSFTLAIAPNLHLLYENCIMEHASDVFVRTLYANCDVTFKNCYFVNMSGRPCRRYGGVFDSFADQDTLLVENCTFVMAQGSVWRFRSYPFNRVIFNHNTFINMAGSAFMNLGYQSNMSVTNNIFVNCDVQPYPAIHSIDNGEQDPDWEPMGLVNVYPDSADVANQTPRKFLCQDNLAYWNPSLANVDSIVTANNVNGVTNWRSQMIIMNSRTDSMFNHIGRFNRTTYAYLITDTWKNEMPHFTDPKDLFTTQLANIKTFAVSTVDTNSLAVLPDWRLINTGPAKYVYPDWPIPVDLSYSDADLVHAGLGGLALGDLNWFPTQKSAWLAQRTEEYKSINDALNAGRLVTAVHDHGSLPTEFQLYQNYPNPFNPSTVISYQLPVVNHVTLRVYDALGREVATLVDDTMRAGSYQAIWDTSGYASGVYFYRLQAGSFTETKRLLLLK